MSNQTCRTMLFVLLLSPWVAAADRICHDSTSELLIDQSIQTPTPKNGNANSEMKILPFMRQKIAVGDQNCRDHRRYK